MGLQMTRQYSHRQQFAAILRSDFLSFAQKAFAELHPATPLVRNWHHQAIAHELVRLHRGDSSRLILNAPPRGLKSFLVSVAFPAWVIGNAPATKFICASYSQDLAVKHASDFRKICQSDWYKRLFQYVSFTKDSESESQTSQGGYRLATSVGGTITGRGADIILVDDPLSAVDAFSKTSRDRVNDWFSGVLLSRLDDQRSGKIVAVMQRLHEDDLTGTLLVQGGWPHLKLPAIAPSDQDIYLSDTRCHVWKADEPLDPVLGSLSILKALKRQLGSMYFAAQYLQEPVSPEGNFLKRDWLREYDFLPTTKPGDLIVQSWDTAMKAKESNDFSVCLTFVVRNNNEYYLIDVVRRRFEFPDLCKFVCAHAQRFAATEILIEDQVSGTSLIQMAKRIGLQGIVAMKPTADKASRMYNQTPKLEMGSLFLPKTASWLMGFVEEYLAFPKGKYDDQIDALSQFLERRYNRENALFEFDFGFEDDERGPRHQLDYLLGV
jgi:predicted phage terminase large subunit-like protein